MILHRRRDLVAGLPVQLKGNVALLCDEKDAMMCHRWTVAEALAKLIEKRPIHPRVAPAGGKTGKPKTDSTRRKR